ncbi:MAG: hypothetical protein RIS64_4274 [Bacteroidota bacterium]
MAIKKNLDDIFNDDPFGLLHVKPNHSGLRNEDERSIAAFQEINDFYEKNQRLPQQNGGIQEYQLFARLKSIQADAQKGTFLQPYDRFGLVSNEPQRADSLEAIFEQDEFGLLNDDSDNDLFQFKHAQHPDKKAQTDFIAQRKPCKDFDNYEALFKTVQKNLSNQKRQLIEFKQAHLRVGEFYVHNGILLYLEQVDYQDLTQTYKSGSRVRKDGRTRVIFENGTESNMLYRSLYKALLSNGKSISQHEDAIAASLTTNYQVITSDDTAAGHLYILTSKSKQPALKKLKNLYKIGYTTTSVAERIKNASQSPTYLMADVEMVMTYECFNVQAQQLEQELHHFFGKACLDLDVFDKTGKRYAPREWFIAPLTVIEQAVQLILNNQIADFQYDAHTMEIVMR